MTREEFVTFLRSARLTADDQTALAGKELYPLWNETAVYKKGDRVRYDGVLYKCLQNHTAQASWTPTDAPSTNPYMKGDKVKHNGKTWVSSIDNNVWAPGVYGWDEVTE